MITLAIIGMVAAMTIPTLISAYNKKAVETRLAKFYSIMNQAIKLSVIENGEPKTWDSLDNTANYQDVENWYNKYLNSYIKTFKTEKYTETNGKERFVIYFSDGSLLKMQIGSSDMFYYPFASRLTKSKSGVSYFWFRFSPSYNSPLTKRNKYLKNDYLSTYSYDWDGTIEGAKNETYENVYGCYQYHAALCAKLIQINNWKIPDDYPYKF